MDTPFVLYQRKMGKKPTYHVKFWDGEAYSRHESIRSLKNQLGDSAQGLSATSLEGAAAIARLWLENVVSIAE